MNPSRILSFALFLSLGPRALAQHDWVEEGRPQWSAAAGFSAVGLSASLEGDRLVLGAPTTSSSLPGKAIFFGRQAALWNEEATVQAGDGTPDDAFGSALELDGPSLLVGAPNANTSSVNGSGAAYVFTFSTGQWTSQAKLAAPDATTNALFGAAVALQGDTAVVGAPQDSSGQGALYVYTRSGSTWSFAQKLVAPGVNFGARMGGAVAIDGDRIAAGARLHPVSGNAVGAVHVFERASGTWSHSAMLTASVPQASSLFGAAVDLEAQRIVVGAPAEGASGLEDSGSVYVFDLGLGGWIETQRLRGAASPTSGQIGSSVALSGTRIAAGGPFDQGLGGGSGGVRLFELSAGSWSETAEIVGSGASAQDQIGRSVALQGARLVVGAANGDVPSLGQKGEGYVFDLAPASPTTYCTAKLASPGCMPAIGWSGTPSASSSSPFLVTATQVVNSKVGLLLTSRLYGTAPFFGGTRCIGLPFKRTSGQFSGGSSAGNDCTGAFSFDFNAYFASQVDPTLSAGDWIWAQYWFRDPLSSFGAGLSNGLRFRIQP